MALSFRTIATLNNNDNHGDFNSYSYLDPEKVDGKVYYRINMRNDINQSRYSRTIQLSLVQENFSFVTVINPFSQSLPFEIYSERGGRVNAELIDPLGVQVKRVNVDIAAGLNHLSIAGYKRPGSGHVYLTRPNGRKNDPAQSDQTKQLIASLSVL